MTTHKQRHARKVQSQIERDPDRAARLTREIAEIFEELNGYAAVEDSLFAQHVQQSARRKQEYQDTKLLDPAEHRRRRARDRARYARIKSERPEVYAQILRRVRERARAHNKGLSTRRLTAASARQLREQHAAGVSQKDLAAIYGLERSQVGRVLSGKAWTHAGGPLGRRRTPARKLTEALVLEIRESAEPEGVIAARLRVCSQTVYDVRIGRTWKHVGGKIAPRKTLARAPFDKKAYQARWQRENRARHAAANARWYERRKQQRRAA